MNLKVFLILIAGLLVSGSVSARRSRIHLGKRKVIDVVAELPKTEEYRLINVQTFALSKNNSFLEVGVMYTTFCIANLPLWTVEEPELVLVDKNKWGYLELPKEKMAEILEENDLNREVLTDIGFYNRYGGKLIFVSIVGGIMFIGLKPRKRY